MGHLRLGRLPKTQRWKKVIDLLEFSPEDSPAIATASLNATDRRLQYAANDPSLAHAFWLLVRVTQAARTNDFQAVLHQLGLPSDEGTSTIRFISAISDQLRLSRTYDPQSGQLAELASLAVRRTLSETIGQQGPGLFGSTLADLQQALRQYSTNQQFGHVAQRFFGDFLARTVTSYLDKELSNYLGGRNTPHSIADNLRVKEAIERHARESARIMRDFAADWYSKNNWRTSRNISEQATQRFVAHALQKVRAEIKVEASR